MKKKTLAITAYIIFILVLVGFWLLNDEAMERRIISGKFYESSTEEAAEVLEFSINPKDYLGYKGEKLGERQLLMEKYDTKVYLEPIKSRGDDLWVNWSFENNWWKASGTCFTFRKIIYENGERLYSDANPSFSVVDENGNRVNEDWGGGGSTYNYGFRIERQVFEDCKSINVKLSKFNIVNYKISLN